MVDPKVHAQLMMIAKNLNAGHMGAAVTRMAIVLAQMAGDEEAESALFPASEWPSDFRVDPTHFSKRTA